MSPETKYRKNQSEHGTLPEFMLLKKNYPKDAWLVIGTLTHAEKTSAETQLRHFRDLMHAIGKPNRTFGQRLHWIVRVGGGAGTENHTHLHFLLAETKITDGLLVRYTADQVVDAIKSHWSRHGMVDQQKVERFDSSRNGLSYVLRDEGEAQERVVEMSRSLRSIIKRRQGTSVVYWDRDPFAVEIIDALRAKDPKMLVGFGDEMDELRAIAAR